MDAEGEITVVGVHKQQIEGDVHKPRHFNWPFILSSQPDSVWIELFGTVYERTRSLDKKEAHVCGDCIRISLPEHADVQRHLNFLKRVIADTNFEYKKLTAKAREPVEKKRNYLKRRYRKKEDILHRLRENADTLKF
jgi:hypothetical protein